MNVSRLYNVNKATREELTYSPPVGLFPYISTLLLAHLAALIQVCMASIT
jgi:hypothetical protein